MKDLSYLNDHDLQETIEDKRRDMETAAQTRPFTDPLVVGLSQDLDDYVYERQKRMAA
jgi:hypothetical protein